MNGTAIVELATPPLPYYLESGLAVYQAGDRHPDRADFGVFDLLIAASGTLHIGENGREWSLGEGDALLLLPRGAHYAVRPCEGETVFYWLHFDHPDWREAAEPAPAEAPANASPFGRPKTIRLPKHLALPDPQLAFDLIRRLQALPIGEAFWEKQQLFFRLLALLEQGRAGAAETPAARVAGSAAFFLQQRYREDVTNETLGERLHYHPSYIVRCMKRVYGVTPAGYLRQYRIEQAKRLLVSTAWPVERIADEVGFRYAPYFSACFKRATGMTPIQYRRRALSRGEPRE
jgi:AraC-like DNA-binding protein